MKPAPPFSAALLALFLALPACAADLPVPLAGHDDLVLTLPDGWRARISQPPGALPPTVGMIAANPRDFELLVTPIWPMGNAKMPTAADTRALVQRAADEARSQAVEHDLPLSEVTAPGKTGYYFSATDRAPKPGEFKYMTQGTVAFGELRVTFTLLSNGNLQGLTAQVAAMLKGMRRAPGKNAL